MKRRVRRALLGLGLLTVVLAVAGAAYESVARHRAARGHPAPGKLVDVGGRRIQIDCRGAGSPTVVLIAGLDHFGSLSWAPIHDSIAQTTRVCAYSRAGIMWSDAARGAFDSGRMADDLHAALAAAGERPPWVMVGHSMGGPYALAFTGRYGAEVAGLVFVDASHPDQRFPVGASAPLRRRVRDAGVNAAGPALLRMGAARLVPVNNRPPSASTDMIAAHRAHFPTSVAALLKENQAIAATLRDAGRHRDLGSRPLVVLTGARGVSPTSRWMQFHQDQATWSTHARHERVDDASHYIHADRPDVVIRAVRDVVGAVRASTAPANPGNAASP
ncbi:alpha/beta fold hydrolase [Longimicrobium sp.]|uniref:alpha/beta fold hydrolase n=1 Tax=Longimicrobium sp. TaxID=2029185 RepID=UPI003B3ABFB1